MVVPAVYVSSLAWQDEDKELAVGFSDGVVRVCFVNCEIDVVTCAAHQVLTATLTSIVSPVSF